MDSLTLFGGVSAVITPIISIAMMAVPLWLLVVAVIPTIRNLAPIIKLVLFIINAGYVMGILTQRCSSMRLYSNNPYVATGTVIFIITSVFGRGFLIFLLGLIAPHVGDVATRVDKKECLIYRIIPLIKDVIFPELAFTYGKLRLCVDYYSKLLLNAISSKKTIGTAKM